MEKATEKQMNFIIELSERNQVLVPSFDDMSKKEADAWIKENLNEKPKVDNVNVSIGKVPEVVMGMTFKKTCDLFMDSRLSPIINQTEFVDCWKQLTIIYMAGFN